MKDVLVEKSRDQLSLRCPRCETDIGEMKCSSCLLELSEVQGVICALPSERKAHYAQFVKNYEQIRAAEGRGGESESFYLELPYRDLSGNNNKQWYIRARSYEFLHKNILKSPEFSGNRILYLGAGNCWMSYRLKLAGYLPVAVDLLINERDGLGAARHYRSRVPELFPRFQAELERLPFRDEQV